jgi:hypothetical protein
MAVSLSSFDFAQDKFVDRRDSDLRHQLFRPKDVLTFPAGKASIFTK